MSKVFLYKRYSKLYRINQINETIHCDITYISMTMLLQDCVIWFYNTSANLILRKGL